RAVDTTGAGWGADDGRAASRGDPLFDPAAVAEGRRLRTLGLVIGGIMVLAIGGAVLGVPWERTYSPPAGARCTIGATGVLDCGGSGTGPVTSGPGPAPDSPAPAPTSAPGTNSWPPPARPALPSSTAPAPTLGPSLPTRDAPLPSYRLPHPSYRQPAPSFDPIAPG
ncbi:hypothetical protein ACSNOD_23810, partial [Streptomyces sp. URMC 123]